MSKVLFVAEIGSAHGGDKSRAFELIRQAKYSQASICKFQFGWTEEAQMKYAGNVNEIRHIDHWADELKEWCDHFDIELMASIWSEEGLETAKSVDMRRYKVSHQVAKDNPAWLIGLYRDAKEIFVSCKRYFGYSGDKIKFLYVPQSYPSYVGELYVPRVFINSTYHGYSSHSHGIADALLAVSRGAQYIEKHFTLNKADKEIRDHSFSLTPNEFAEMVRIGDEMARLV